MDTKISAINKSVKSVIQTMDSTQKAQMYDIAESGAHVSPKAHAVLYLADSTTFSYPIEKIEYAASKWGGEGVNNKPMIKGSSENLKFKIYPNPNDGRMTLDYTLEGEQATFLMYEITGRMVETVKLFKGTHKIAIERSELNSGIYLFRIRDNKEWLYNGKIVVIK